MKRIYILAILLAVVSSIVLTTCTIVQPGVSPSPPPYPYHPEQGWGGGMMGGGMMGGGMMGGGMMGGGMMGGGMMGSGMMGGPSTYNPNAQQITIDQAAEAVERYLKSYGRDLTLTEVMEFTGNFYAEAAEKATGIHAMELLVDKYTGQVSPEMGPNMMWNVKYGMMGSYNGSSSSSAPLPITPEQAQKLAEQFLNTNLPGVTVDEVDTFYGYYTLHTLRNNQLEGMLSVNGYSGAVWYHTWHGPFIKMKEFE